MKGVTNYFDLYSSRGLPIQEAYFLAEFNYYLTGDPAVFEMIESLRLEICRLGNRAPYSDSDAVEYCRKYMEKAGFYEEEVRYLFFPHCSFYGNHKMRLEQYVRNNVDYYGLYRTGAVSLHEAYVLAKNKEYLLFDERMLTMIFAIEDLIMEECRSDPSLGNSVASYMRNKGYRFRSEEKDFYIPFKASEEPDGENDAVKEPVGPSIGCSFESFDAYDVYSSNIHIRDEAIVYCHGGAFKYGDKGDNKEFLTALAEKTSMRVYSVGYRNLDEARKIRTMIDDIDGVISQITAKDKIKRFHLIGASSGAYLAWILSILTSNPGKFDTSSDYSIVSAILLSGYFVFNEKDSITQALYLYPTFQDFPKEIKDVDMNYHGYRLPPVMLISGEEDGCLEDCKVLYNAVKRSKMTEVEMVVLKSDDDKADHCFMVHRPNSGISKKALNCIRAFISKKECKESAELSKLSYGANPIKEFRFFGPSTAEELCDLQEHIGDEGILQFYRYMGGCAVINQNGEIRIFSPKELLSKLSSNKFIGLIPIGSIKDQGLLFASRDGKISLFEEKSFDPENPNAATKIKQWDGIGSLLQFDLK